MENDLPFLVRSWQDLRKVKPNDTHYIQSEPDLECAWIHHKNSDNFEYLSPSTFYGGEGTEVANKLLAKTGFNVIIQAP